MPDPTPSVFSLQALPHIFYFIVMGLALIGWLALSLFPRQRWANFWFAGLVAPMLLCLIYMFFLVVYWFQPHHADPNVEASLVQFFTLKGVYTMFGIHGLLLVGWINIVAMDLVVGAWMTRKAGQIGMPYLHLLPCLIMTFVFAGFGFALFTVLVGFRGGWAKIAKFEDLPSAN